MRSLIFLLLLSFNATAALYDRGNGLIYDDVLDITWLQDANYAQTSGFDSDGRMTWGQAKDWAENLEVGSFNEWRLPTTIDENNDGCNYSQLGGTDCGYDVNTSSSEMSSLFYDSLNNNSNYGGNNLNSSLFINLKSESYWSQSGLINSNVYAWSFNFFDGAQMPERTNRDDYVWPVHDGDIGASPVPLPAGIYLFLSGLVGLGLMRGRNV